MPRVIGVDIPDKKRLVISLTYIFGIGRPTAFEICEKLGFDPNRRAHELTEDEIAKLARLLQQEYVVEGERQREVQNAIKRLIAVRCYRGQRHRQGLPVRGQRTSTNARTRKGRKKTVAGKKK